MDTVVVYDEGVAVCSDSVDDDIGVSVVVVCMAVSGATVEDVDVCCV